MTDFMPQDEHFMRRAIRLAVKGRGRTSPNPIVGAVVVRDGHVVGDGFHQQLGGPHAEVHALRRAGRSAHGATLYVTLEPCNHHGRTPPCTEAILLAGIARVVIGMSDPNPKVTGGGAERLRQAGLSVTMGVLEKECRALNQPFIKWVTQGRPHVTLKCAATLDGRTATRTGDSRWVSGEASRRLVHKMRATMDAVLVGIGTALADDPLLTARLGAKTYRQPVRIVLDAQARLPLASQLVQTAQQNPVLVACSDIAPKAARERLTAQGVQVVVLPFQDPFGVDLKALLNELGRRSITSVLVEGGSRIQGAFLDHGLADDCYFFYAPKILGDASGVPMFQGRSRLALGEAVPLYACETRRVGQDILVYGRFSPELL
ncbi:bifunctional diaminohydroxyphosphoribosylaminopyrimidine deaminase/5-amino-6-(5-phosphoribosylamino)uracil reductase RibD [Desulfosoma sp.]|uniref:bifunctional diaminohydroxyphosphoribosylaminopyrimidine deaminase/5-amino-6-(5-phosphoribosylamino)uracil reductase RibD n=1 Tax=Desulfosoma sp. TaxID=2603217 RepID=UPI00404A9EA8